MGSESENLHNVSSSGKSVNQQSVRPIAGLLAEYPSEHTLVRCAEQLRDAGYRHWDVFSPYPIHGLARAMGLRRAWLGKLIFLAGIGGAALAVWLQWYTNAVDYPLIVSGKPFVSWPTYAPVVFELVVLLCAVAAFGGVLAITGLPRFSHPLRANPRFRRATRDGLFVFIDAKDPRFDPELCRELLTGLGAVAVEEVPVLPPSPVPRALYWGIAFAAILALVPPLWITYYRMVPKRSPRIHLILDMDAQPKVKPQSFFPYFADLHGERPAVPGTLARGEMVEDPARLEGKNADGSWVETIPIPVTRDLALRGQESYRIYCAPCHGLTGGPPEIGSVDDPLKYFGMVVRRAQKRGQWIPPISLHAESVRQQPVGQIFHTITHGIRSMPGYAAQIPVDDRWAIVLYVRSLQRSQRATLEDVPAEERRALR